MVTLPDGNRTRTPSNPNPGELVVYWLGVSGRCGVFKKIVKVEQSIFFGQFSAAKLVVTNDGAYSLHGRAGTSFKPATCASPSLAAGTLLELIRWYGITSHRQSPSVAGCRPALNLALGSADPADAAPCGSAHPCWKGLRGTRTSLDKGMGADGVPFIPFLITSATRASWAVFFDPELEDCEFKIPPKGWVMLLPLLAKEPVFESTSVRNNDLVKDIIIFSPPKQHPHCDRGD
ncbi:hypothetical protein DFJ73DRAFT_760732 [Zopfochytrium polystomum]|nr:hypothetical protein DFJ73DRAFT_760732 [Zopfochytrium polystomum]